MKRLLLLCSKATLQVQFQILRSSPRYLRFGLLPLSVILYLDQTSPLECLPINLKLTLRASPFHSPTTMNDVPFCGASDLGMAEDLLVNRSWAGGFLLYTKTIRLAGNTAEAGRHGLSPKPFATPLEKAPTGMRLSDLSLLHDSASLSESLWPHSLQVTPPEAISRRAVSLSHSFLFPPHFVWRWIVPHAFINNAC